MGTMYILYIIIYSASNFSFFSHFIRNITYMYTRVLSDKNVTREHEWKNKIAYLPSEANSAGVVFLRDIHNNNMYNVFVFINR